ncbi:MAG: hypothetical protein Tsb002_21850 [Wenzhouxiangellaceae bacterium]
MFRTTSHRVFNIPHGVALAAGFIALASWAWSTQAVQQAGQQIAAQEELANASVEEGGKALLDLGLILLLRSGSH